MWQTIKSILGGTRQPAAPFEDPELGRFELTSEGWWTVRYSTGKAIVRLNVNGVEGKEPSPDPVELETLRRNLARFEQFQGELFAYLNREAIKYPGVDPALFSVDSIDHLWSDHSGHFFVYLKHPEDEYKLWRVEYFGNKPGNLAFDK